MQGVVNWRSPENKKLSSIEDRQFPINWRQQIAFIKAMHVWNTRFSSLILRFPYEIELIHVKFLCSKQTLSISIYQIASFLVVACASFRDSSVLWVSR